MADRREESKSARREAAGGDAPAGPAASGAAKINEERQDLFLRRDARGEMTTEAALCLTEISISKKETREHIITRAAIKHLR